MKINTTILLLLVYSFVSSQTISLDEIKSLIGKSKKEGVVFFEKNGYQYSLTTSQSYMNINTFTSIILEHKSHSDSAINIVKLELNDSNVIEGILLVSPKEAITSLERQLIYKDIPVSSYTITNSDLFKEKEVKFWYKENDPYYFLTNFILIDDERIEHQFHVLKASLLSINIEKGLVKSYKNN